MATSSYNDTTNYKVTDSQKECCAVIAMREAVETLAEREKISYEEALLRFTSSRAYEALFDYETEIWKEGSDYLLNIYDYCNKIDQSLCDINAGRVIKKSLDELDAMADEHA